MHGVWKCVQHWNHTCVISFFLSVFLSVYQKILSQTTCDQTLTEDKHSKSEVWQVNAFQTEAMKITQV